MLTKTSLNPMTMAYGKRPKPWVLLAEASRRVCYVRRQEIWHQVPISTPSYIIALWGVFERYIEKLSC
jgi:hypothetical protein